MSFRAAAASAAIVLGACALPARAPAAPLLPAPAVATGAHVAGEVLVVLDDASPLELAPGGALRARDAVVARALAARGLDRWQPIGRGRSAGAPRLARLVSRDPAFDPRAAAGELVSSGVVRAAIPNLRLRLHATIPNDNFLAGYQWSIQSASDADVDLPEAWDVTQGDTSVVIGVVDTGVDTGHPDLDTQIWRNWGEIPGNGLDDDGNGYVDDVRGWDFGDGDADPNPVPFFDSSGLDVGFHGTFVAGIAAAATNDGDGIAGAGWRSRILPLKVASSANEMTSDALAEAILYAADLGVDVLNLSLGAPNQPGVAEFFQPLVDAYNASGGVMIASAGNDGADSLTFPAANAGVVAVGATDEANARAPFSNHGAWVDLAAPGALMWSSLSTNYEIDPLTQFFFMLFFGWDGLEPYMYGDGTSFAAPLAAGTAALVRAAHPWMTGAQVAAHLVATGDSVAYDQPIGLKLNAYTAVSTGAVAAPVPAAGAAGLALAGAAPHPVRGGATLRFALPAAARARLRLYDTQGRLVRTLADGAFAAGPHALRWDAGGADGRPLPGGVYLLALESDGRRATRRLVVMR